MEKNAADNLKTYLVDIPASEELSLGAIRHWKNLSVAFDGDIIWIKGFTTEQAFSAELRQIPFADIFELKEGLLFKAGHLVPSRRMRSGLLWNPVQRGFPLSLGNINHNYFGMQQKIPVRLVQTENEKNAVALLCSKKNTAAYILNAPAIRLKPVKWCLLNGDALFIGTPLLSLPGTAYWSRGNHLLPAGYDFEFPVLEKNIQRSLDPEGSNWLIWFAAGDCLLVPKDSMVPLSISSFRLSDK